MSYVSSFLYEVTSLKPYSLYTFFASHRFRHGVYAVSVVSGLPKRGRESNTLVGDDSDGGPPDPIPNSVVKPDHADGTARVTLWESRYRRPSFIKPLVDFHEGFFIGGIALTLVAAVGRLGCLGGWVWCTGARGEV